MAARVEAGVAAGLTAMAVVLHVRFFFHGGPLWRDEISSVGMATTSSWAALFAYWGNDSIPLVWHAVLRAWAAVGLGATDRGWRTLGLGVGMVTLGLLWWHGRRVGGRVPLASLALVGMGPVAVVFGDSLRAYGPGVAVGLFSSGAIWAVARARRNVAAMTVVAMAASMVSVHTLFLNGAWLLAACVAGAAVCLRHGRRARAVGVLGIGVACAASLAVYLPLFRDRAASAQLFVRPTTVGQVLASLRDAVTYTPLNEVTVGGWTWAAAVVGAAATVLVFRRRQLARPDDDGPDDRAIDVAVFAAVQLTLGVVATVGCLRVLSNAMGGYYFLSLMALVAVAVDAALATVRPAAGRVAIAVAVVAVAMVRVGPAWRSAACRMSNVDWAAARIASSAAAGDVVVVSPWELGSPFARHYRGPATVLTVPPMSDLRVQRFDLMLAQMRNPAAIDPVLTQVATCLRSGRRVWVVQNPYASFAADPAAGGPTSTWGDAEFCQYWNRQVGQSIRECGGRPASMELPKGTVNPLEDVRVWVAQR